MTGLAALDLRTSYRKGRDDIAHEFYLPVMEVATTYDRAVGYFRSSIFIIAWSALRGFVQRGGKLRILCSQVMSQGDLAALDQGYAARVDEELAARLQAEVESLLADDDVAEPTRILAALVAENVVELKVAILRPAAGAAEHRIFHDKVGIVSDAHGARVAFKGSMNETWGGLADGGNLESVDVFCDWIDGRDAERVADEVDYFSELWSNNYPGLTVQPFPEVARESLVAAAPRDWETALEHLIEAAATEAPARPESSTDSKGRKLKQHQSDGLASWRRHGRRGILAFVTGAGKTFTALHALRESILKYGEVPVIVAPDKLLFEQWYDELKPLAEELDVRVLRAGAGHDHWRGVLRSWTAPGDDRRLVLTTVQTARQPDFHRRLAKDAGLFLVADEVHRLGSPSNQALMDDRIFGPRLGLSATPERAGDSDGTTAILTFFEGIREPRYALADAIRDRVLTPYFYRPHTISLTDDESAQWDKLTQKIVRLRARLGDGAADDDGLERLYFERARIVKQAGAKIELAVSVIRDNYSHGDRWLIYCDDRVQLEAVRSALASAGYRAMPYYSAMDSSKDETLHWLSEYGGIVVAIRCLDEGVDIPAVTHALILASSKNPREFIQRRGRVLRRAANKVYAYIHDAIVSPPRPEDGAGPDPITLGELARAIEFAQGAANAPGVAELINIAIDAGIDWQSLTKTGLEDRDDDE